MKKKKSVSHKNISKNTIFFIAIIFVIAIFFRFFNYPNRIGLASDQARDALIALEALRLHTLPLIGHFLCFRPFVFGQYQYWFLMLLEVLMPFGYISFWIGLTIVSCLMVFFMILLGKEIEDIRFGLLLGLFAAVSSAKVGLATNLVSSTLAGFLSTIAVYFLVRSIKYTSFWNYFFLGFFISLAMNTHLQAIPLFLLVPAVFLWGKFSIKNVLLLLFGLIIPFIPLMIFDVQTHFYESSHLIQFFLFPDTTTSIPKRWLTYAGVTWPRFWGLIIGGNAIVGTMAVVSAYLLLGYYIFKKKANKIILIVAGIYAFIFVLFRYFSGRIFGNFTTFLDPFILILVTWMCIEFVKKNKYVGAVVIGVILFFTIFNTYSQISTATNNTDKNTAYLIAYFATHFPPKRKIQVI